MNFLWLKDVERLFQVLLYVLAVLFGTLGVGLVVGLLLARHLLH